MMPTYFPCKKQIIVIYSHSKIYNEQIIKKSNNMKKLKIIKEGLIEADLFLDPLENVKVFKLTEEQAFSYGFFEEDADFNELVAKYGNDKILSEGEFYDGYAILYEERSNELIRMCGSVESFGEFEELPNLALNNAKLYQLCYENANDQETTGYAKYVRTFGNARFEIVGNCSDSLADTLRQKLVEGAISGNTIELSDEEYRIIHEYFPASEFSELFEFM